MDRHAVQYYDDEAHFAALVSGYLADGLEAGEHAVVIATSAHRHAIEEGWPHGSTSRRPARAAPSPCTTRPSLSTPS